MIPQQLTNLDDYPRPLMRRQHWLNLDGEWLFQFDPNHEGIKESWQIQIQEHLTLKINVPFVYNCKNSGINKQEYVQHIWYGRKFTLSADQYQHKRVILHFEACDYYCKVWINKVFVGEHKGGFLPFQFDITPFVNVGEQENEVAVWVEDLNSPSQILGKQSWQPTNFLCWYSKIIGIWQSVWIEPISEAHINDIRLTPEIDKEEVQVSVECSNETPITAELQIAISIRGQNVLKMSSTLKKHKLLQTISLSSNFPMIQQWYPQLPNVFDIEFTLKNGETILDSAKSHFGLKKMSTQNGRIFLNNHEYFQKIVLFQGYYPNSLLTAPNNAVMIDVITKIKQMGFNGIRIHQKLETPRFLYLCDLLGMSVWCDLPSFYEFDSSSQNECIETLQGMIKRYYNHPSITTWVLMNESWGINSIASDPKQQNFVKSLFHLAKSQDTNRLIVDNDGWDHVKTDILTIHDYCPSPEIISKRFSSPDFPNETPSFTSLKSLYVKGKKHKNEPIFISEFGGINYSKEPKEGDQFGYQEAKAPDELESKIKNLCISYFFINQVCGICYTQFSDVEQETNGLVDAQFQYKITPEKIKDILQLRPVGGFDFS